MNRSKLYVKLIPQFPIKEYPLTYDGRFCSSKQIFISNFQLNPSNCYFIHKVDYTPHKVRNNW
jgi:hypothetical protein